MIPQQIVWSNRFRAVLAGAGLLSFALLCLPAATIATSVWAQPCWAAQPPAKPKSAMVRLEIRYGDGVELHFTQLAWREGMTVLDALNAVSKHRHGVSVVQRGSGTSAMITQIGDLKNEGDGRNWLFSVNGKTSDVGAGAAKLNQGDSILWEFKTYEYNP